MKCDTASKLIHKYRKECRSYNFFLRNYAQVLKDYLQAMVQDVKESTGPLFRAATRHTLGEGKFINLD